MEITVTSNSNATVATLNGRLDTPASVEAAPVFESLKEKTDGTVILDCKELSYISSSGLRLFLTLLKASNANGGKVIVRSICPEIRNVFMMTGFLNLFQIED